MKTLLQIARVVAFGASILLSESLFAQWTSGSLNSSIQTTGGNVGIGVAAPSSKLHIRDGSNGEQLRLARGSGEVRFTQDSNYDNLSLYNKNGSTLMMFWHGNGNTGMGTKTPLSRLSVNGGIRAKEVRIMTDISIPDYVFENTYTLRSLSEVETFIKENKHLPEVPSAKEIEERGLNVAEMDAALLKKIEELTLYLLEQDKKIQRLESENRAIKRQLDLK